MTCPIYSIQYVVDTGRMSEYDTPVHSLPTCSIRFPNLDAASPVKQYRCTTAAHWCIWSTSGTEEAPYCDILGLVFPAVPVFQVEGYRKSRHGPYTAVTIV